MPAPERCNKSSDCCCFMPRLICILYQTRDEIPFCKHVLSHAMQLKNQKTHLAFMRLLVTNLNPSLVSELMENQLVILLTDALAVADMVSSVCIAYSRWCVVPLVSAALKRIIRFGQVPCFESLLEFLQALCSQMANFAALETELFTLAIEVTNLESSISLARLLGISYCFFVVLEGSNEYGTARYVRWLRAIIVSGKSHNGNDTSSLSIRGNATRERTMLEAFSSLMMTVSKALRGLTPSHATIANGFKERNPALTNFLSRAGNHHVVDLSLSNNATDDDNDNPFSSTIDRLCSMIIADEGSSSLDVSAVMESLKATLCEDNNGTMNDCETIADSLMNGFLRLLSNAAAHSHRIDRILKQWAWDFTWLLTLPPIHSAVIDRIR